MSRRVWVVVGAVGLLLLLLVGSLALSAWILAEEADLAPPLEPAVQAAVKELSEVALSGPVPPVQEPEPWALEPERHCPVTVFVETEGGDPVGGEVWLSGGEGWVSLGRDGEADWPLRRCGRTENVRLRTPNTPGQVAYRVAYEETDEVTLVLGSRAEAWVRPVDEAGNPIEAEVRPGVEQTDGWVHVQKRGSESIGVSVSVPGERGGVVQVPLDGGEHDVEVPRDRLVDVTLLCDQCPGYVVCTQTSQGQGPACEGQGQALVCQCPAKGTAALVLRSPSALLDWQEEIQVLAMVSEDEEEVEIDVRGEPGSVRAQVEVEAGSTVVVQVDRPGAGASGRHGRDVPSAGGHVEVVGLLPGDWELTLQKVTVHSRTSVEREQTQVPFTLRAGEALDLGSIAL